MLLRNLVSAKESVVVKKVFRKCESFSDVNSLHNICVAFEEAHKDTAVPDFDRNLGWETIPKNPL